MDPARILIVDDDISVTRILRRIFEKSGYAVTAANNGEEALATLTHTRFDALICDIQMPRMDGRQLCRHLATSGPYLPDCVFVVTSLPEEEERAWVEKYPSISVIEKPVSPKELLQEVTRQLEQKAGNESDGGERRAA